MSRVRGIFAGVLVLAVLTAALPCHAAWISWTGAIDDDFMKVGNWNSIRVPDTANSDVATFSNGGTAVLSDPWSVYRVYYANANGGTLVVASGGSLTVPSSVQMAYSQGALVVDGGTFTSNWTRLGVYAGALGKLTVNNPASVYNDLRLAIGDYQGDGEATFGRGDINVTELVLASSGSTHGKLTVIGGDNDIVLGSFEKRYGVGTLRFELNAFTPQDDPLVSVLGNARFRDNSFLEIDLGAAPAGTYVLMEAGSWSGTSYLGTVSPASDMGYTTYFENDRLMLNVTRAVPEPTTMAGLAVLGAAALVRRRRRLS